MTIKRLITRVDKLEVNAPDPEDSKIIIELLSKDTIKQLIECYDEETKQRDLSLLTNEALDELEHAFKSTGINEAIIS